MKKKGGENTRKERSVLPGDWEEPAHKMTLGLRDDLTAIYARIREKYQKAIDNAFDRVSRQIGYVITTSVPVMFEVGSKGKVKSISMEAEHLKDTLFDRELTRAVKGIMVDPIPSCEAGTYKLHLFWFEALKLRLRTDWMEPVHFLRKRLARPTRTELRTRVVPGVREPVHWFDPGTAIVAEEAVLISVIDDVYPELRLTERIASNRAALRREVQPEVREPVHFPRREFPITPEEFQELLRLLRIMATWV